MEMDLDSTFAEIIPSDPIDNNPALVQVMAQRRKGAERGCLVYWVIS